MARDVISKLHLKVPYTEPNVTQWNLFLRKFLTIKKQTRFTWAMNIYCYIADISLL